MTEAMAAVTRKVATVVPRTLPALRISPILAMAEAMEQNTIGTTTQNIRLINTVPSGSSTVAPALTTSPSTVTTGHSQPTMQPATIPTSMERMNQLFFRKELDFIDVRLLKRIYQISLLLYLQAITM